MTVTREAADLILDDIEAIVQKNADTMPEDEFWSWFAGETDVIEDNVAAGDQAHVRGRIDCMLRNAGKLPGDELPCS